MVSQSVSVMPPNTALQSGREAAAGRDVRIGGGPNTIQQYLREGLIDELHIPIAPVLLGSGQRLFEGVNLRALGYECVEFAASEKATHVVLRHQGPTASLIDQREGTHASHHDGRSCCIPHRLRAVGLHSYRNAAERRLDSCIWYGGIRDHIQRTGV